MTFMINVAFTLMLGGANFIRWGRRDCDDTASGTTLVYSGKVLQITVLAQHITLLIQTKSFKSNLFYTIVSNVVLVITLVIFELQD